MAKKKSEGDVLDTTAYAQSLEEETTAPEIVETEPESLFGKDEVEQAVTLFVPRTILYALLDPTFPESDVRRAEELGLLVDGQPTEFGLRIVNGSDVIALRHKMIRAWRAQHNAEIDAQPGRVERA